MEITNQENLGLLLSGDKIFEEETVAMTLSSSAGSIADTTVYPVATQANKTLKLTVDGGSAQTITFDTEGDVSRLVTTNNWPVGTLDTLTFKCTVDGGNEQTVTFSGAITTRDQVLAALQAGLVNCRVYAIGDDAIGIESLTKKTGTIVRGTDTATGVTTAAAAKVNYIESIALNIAAQLEGAKVKIKDGQLLITSDSEGASSSVAVVTGGNTNLTFATATDGTGVTGTLAAGTILARNSVDSKLVPYNTNGSNSTNEPVAILTKEAVYTSTGEKKLRVLKRGVVNKNKLVKHDDSSAISAIELDKLVKNTGIVVQDVTVIGAYDNQ